MEPLIVWGSLGFTQYKQKLVKGVSAAESHLVGQWRAGSGETGGANRLLFRQLLKDFFWFLPHLAAPGASTGDRGAVAASCLSEHVGRPISSIYGSEHAFRRGGMPG